MPSEDLSGGQLEFEMGGEGKRKTHPLASNRSLRASALTTHPSCPPKLATCPFLPPAPPPASARRSKTFNRLSSDAVMRREEVNARERMGEEWAAVRRVS